MQLVDWDRLNATQDDWQYDSAPCCPASTYRPPVAGTVPRAVAGQPCPEFLLPGFFPQFAWFPQMLDTKPRFSGTTSVAHPARRWQEGPKTPASV